MRRGKYRIATNDFDFSLHVRIIDQILSGLYLMSLSMGVFMLVAIVIYHYFKMSVEKSADDTYKP